MAEYDHDDADDTEPLRDFGAHILDIGTMETDAFGNLAVDRVNGIERGRGLLKNIRDATATNGADLFLAHSQNILALEKDSAIGELRWRRGKKAGEGEGGDALSAATLTNDGQRVAVRHRKRRVFYGIEHAVFRSEADGEIFNFEEWRFHCGRVSEARRMASPTM